MSKRLNKENKKEFIEDLKRKASFTSKKRIRHITDNLLTLYLIVNCYIPAIEHKRIQEEQAKQQAILLHVYDGYKSDTIRELLSYNPDMSYEDAKLVVEYLINSSGKGIEEINHLIHNICEKNIISNDEEYHKAK